MLEFFLMEHLCGSNEDENKEHFMVRDNGLGVIALAISILAAYLAYQKNAGESTGVKILVTLVAFFFSQLYILYYVVRYVIFEMLNNKKRSSGKKRSSRKKR